VQVGVANGDTDPDAARDRDHRCLKSSRTCCRASVSTSRSTRTRQPRPSSISTIPALARCAGGEDGGCGAHVNAGAAVEVISTGTRADTASPLNPAVARQAAPREQLARRQPIASRSHRHQSWPAIALGKNATRFAYHEVRPHYGQNRECVLGALDRKDLDRRPSFLA
jgi:hypothetical protein